ncbi:MAG: ATPase, partial [Phenylobacterium sp.]|nr:ATPase [Phenylobacterium sp.]
ASHELRTPLASLAGFVETLRTHAKDDPAARDKFLGIMAEQAGRMARLIDDLLSLSRIELNEHIAPEGVVDFGQLVQVAQNLVENAVKYSAPGTVVAVELARAGSLETARAGSGREGWVSLSLLSPDAAAGHAFVTMRVIDKGPGMARQHLPRLSERFYRVAGQKSGGTGLGLAIVKHIVNRHRGGILVESAEGQGTTFSVYLPAA